MKNNFFFSLVLSAILCVACTPKNDTAWFDNAVERAHEQILQMADEIGVLTDTHFPRSLKDGEYKLIPVKDWTSGFFPGNLWLCYEQTGDSTLAIEARRYTNRLAELQYYKGTHDLGFMVFCSYGQAERLAPENTDLQVILNASDCLTSRYDSIRKVIRSWDFGEWTYPVIIDNMMNLEMLFWASEVSGNPYYREVAVSHANTTLANHFRPDGSSYHVVSYKADGSVESQGTFQGYSDDSSWARGQAWGLYGYTMCYRFTHDSTYLEQAEKIANYIMTNRPSENDYVPYWDYNAPDIPKVPRDASAAAVTASALLELQQYVADGQKYTDYAENILKQLSSPEYLSKKGENHGFILKHAVGHLPANSEIDTPLIYADYYYLEALLRYKELKNL